MNTIGFRNKTQVLLWKLELCGQISDGHWENAKPFNHYKEPCSAKVIVAENENQLGKNFYSRKYNFASSELLSVVSYRMLFFVKVSMYFKDMSIENIRLLNLFVFCNDCNFHDKNIFMEYMKKIESYSQHYVDKIKQVMNLLNVNSYEELNDLLIKIEEVPYGKSLLKKELKDMSDIFNNMRIKC